MKTDQESLPNNRKTRSFRISDFTLRDLPYLMIAFVLMTLFSWLFGWVPLKFLSEKWSLFLLALVLGFSLGMLFWQWVAGSEPKTNYGLSSQVQALARDPEQLIAAIKLFRQEHPDVSLTQAKERIERFCKTGQ